MHTQPACPECSALWKAGTTCEGHFHQMLYWENEDPQRGIVHHLMILGYYLQHPSLYSPPGLEYSLQLLEDFVERGVSPQQVPKQKLFCYGFGPAQLENARQTWLTRLI